MSEITFTIVEPSFEFIDRNNMDYLKFLEICTRTCYKSEDLIKEGSAEKLLDKVVRKYEHLSVVEHESCIVHIKVPMAAQDIFVDIIEANPLFATRITLGDEDNLLVSGNIRMWMEFLQNHPPAGQQECWFSKGIKYVLHQKWPFFFADEGRQSERIRLIDDNPVTNNDHLVKEEMLKHMTLTYRLIGSRSFSHQNVRHRINAHYSQESQRYVNYGKQGFQFIMPPSIKELSDHHRTQWIKRQVSKYKEYLRYQHLGIKGEDARYGLPNCCKTEIVETYTLKMWQHIFKHRAENKKAQWEIRNIMSGIQKHATNLLPGVFDEG